MRRFHSSWRSNHVTSMRSGNWADDDCTIIDRTSGNANGSTSSSNDDDDDEEARWCILVNTPQEEGVVSRRTYSLYLSHSGSENDCVWCATMIGSRCRYTTYTNGVGLLSRSVSHSQVSTELLLCKPQCLSVDWFGKGCAAGVRAEVELHHLLMWATSCRKLTDWLRQFKRKHSSEVNVLAPSVLLDYSSSTRQLWQQQHFPPLSLFLPSQTFSIFRLARSRFSNWFERKKGQKERRLLRM